MCGARVSLLFVDRIVQGLRPSSCRFNLFIRRSICNRYCCKYLLLLVDAARRYVIRSATAIFFLFPLIISRFNYNRWLIVRIVLCPVGDICNSNCSL